MTVMTFQIIGHSAVFWKHVLADSKGDIHTLTGDVIVCNTEIVFCSIVITMTPHDRHDVLKDCPLDYLLNCISWQTDNISHNLVIWI